MPIAQSACIIHKYQLSCEHLVASIDYHRNYQCHMHFLRHSSQRRPTGAYAQTQSAAPAMLLCDKVFIDFEKLLCLDAKTFQRAFKIADGNGVVFECVAVTELGETFVIDGRSGRPEWVVRGLFILDNVRRWCRSHVVSLRKL